MVSALTSPLIRWLKSGRVLEDVVVKPTWNTESAPARGPEATELLWEYLDEMVSRYHGRPATESEIRHEVEETASDALEPPRGALLMAWCEGELAGCVGVRLLGDGVAEMKRVYLRKRLRGCGGGVVLVESAEQTARTLGARVMRLDTRSDLVEARVLYARLGYEEVPAYAPSPYAEHWFEKSLVA